MERTFPDSFRFGTATAATQIEGHCTTSDWWEFAQTPGRIRGGDVPHPACDSWHRFEDDIELQTKLGLNAHRMSVEWARIEPAPNEFDHAAIDRYRGMLGALRDSGIEPMVTLHHFTLPRWVAQRGGLLSPELPDYFDRFVRVVVGALGDLVPRWITINEPNAVATLGYLLGMHPPGRSNPIQAVRAHQNLLAMHVRGYHAAHEVAAGRGWPLEAGVAHHLRLVEPMSQGRLDRFGTRVFDETFNWAFFDALAGKPRPVMEQAVLASVRARRVDAAGTHDFVGLNYYSRDLIRFSHRHGREMFIHRSVPPSAEISDLGWEVFPDGLGRLIRACCQRTGLPVYVTENGIADARDAQRASFLVRHLAQVADAIAEGFDVRGYYHWTLIDNFEWSEGYEPKFGLYAVELESQRREARASAEVYRTIASSRRIDEATWERYGGVPEQGWRQG